MGHFRSDVHSRLYLGVLGQPHALYARYARRLNRTDGHDSVRLLLRVNARRAAGRQADRPARHAAGDALRHGSAADRAGADGAQPDDGERAGRFRQPDAAGRRHGADGCGDQRRGRRVRTGAGPLCHDHHSRLFQPGHAGRCAGGPIDDRRGYQHQSSFCRRAAGGCADRRRGATPSACDQRRRTQRTDAQRRLYRAGTP